MYRRQISCAALIAMLLVATLVVQPQPRGPAREIIPLRTAAIRTCLAT